MYSASSAFLRSLARKCISDVIRSIYFRFEVLADPYDNMLYSKHTKCLMSNELTGDIPIKQVCYTIQTRKVLFPLDFRFLQGLAKSNMMMINN